MSKTRLDFLFRADPPWLYIGSGEAERGSWSASHFYSQPGLDMCVRRFRGRKMRCTRTLMDEFGAALQFFDGFGENWYALEECLGYLDEWLPADGYVLVIEQAEELLMDEDEREAVTFLRVMDAVGRHWSKPVNDGGRFDRPARPFHVLLHISEVGPRNRWIETAHSGHIEIRTSTSAVPGTC